MSAPQVRRRPVLEILQELAAKTPLDEPLLITPAEARAYRDIQVELTKNNGSGFLPGFSYAGRELLVINEQSLIPNLSDYRSPQQETPPGRGLFSAAVDEEIQGLIKDLTPTRELTIPTREMGARIQTQGAGVALPEEFIEQRRRDIQALAAERKYQDAGNPAQQAQGYAGIERSSEPQFRSGRNEVRFIGEDSKFPGMGGVGRVVLPQTKAPASSPMADITADEYRRLKDLFVFAPPEAKVSEAAFVKWGADQLAQDRASRAAATTERNIPVGVPRGYFEE